MAVAAVPSYVKQELFAEAPPGHRFGLYFQLWNLTDWLREADSKDDKDKGKQGAIRRIIPFGNDAWRMASSLLDRQKALADVLGDSVWRLPAQSVAPFMTGLGNEHPLENGFAFLNPYGIPYLPGSGVKGVLRQAAENLVCGDYGDTQGWSQQIIDALFGRETASGDNETNRNRGALMFWDVIPEPASGQLAVDIMTPHYGDYYQGNTTPHDSGQPNPILFLTVPPGSRFEFFVQCDPAMLPKSLGNSWQTLLESAFRHAFDWLGFGAKTAVGYGAMRTVETVPRQRSKPDETKKSAPAASEIQGSAITAPETGPQRWENAALSWNKGKRELYSATAQGKAFAGGKEGMDLREKLSAEQRNKLDKGKAVTATLIVERIGGNNWRIVEIV